MSKAWFQIFPGLRGSGFLNSPVLQFQRSRGIGIPAHYRRMEVDGEQPSFVRSVLTGDYGTPPECLVWNSNPARSGCKRGSRLNRPLRVAPGNQEDGFVGR